MTNTIESPRVYVGTYKKYNEGSLFGEWVTLSDFSDKDEFLEYCQELHEDESDPEFMFQDWEATALFKDMISESYVSENVWTAISALENASYEPEMYEAYAECFGADTDDIEQLISDAEDAYHGQYDSDEDFAEEMAEQCGMLDKKPVWPYTCIDWEHAARELMYDYCEHNGYYFRNC